MPHPKPFSITFGPVDIEYRPPIARYVCRRNASGKKFNGKTFDAIVTGEVVNPTTLYVCGAITTYTGGVSQILYETVDYFIGLGFTHATFVKDLDARKVLLKALKRGDGHIHIPKSSSQDTNQFKVTYELDA